MDDALTRLAFRVQGGDLDAARTLLLEAHTRQQSISFERAAKALGGSIVVLSQLEQTVTSEERVRAREVLPSPAEAAATFTPVSVDLDAFDRLGATSLVTTCRWAIEGLSCIPRYGAGQPYLGAGVAGPWLHVLRVFRMRVEAPWLALRVIAALDPAKKALTDAIVKGTFTILGARSATAAQAVLAAEALPARRALWSKLVAEFPSHVDDLSLCALLDDAPTRELASAVLLRRGAAAAKHAMPFLHASAPGTRRAVAGLLAITGDSSFIPLLRQAIARERDSRTRAHLTAALEQLSGAEPLVPRISAGVEDTLVARARAALISPRQPKPPAWLRGAEVPRMLWRDGEIVNRAEIEALVGRMTLLRVAEPDSIIPDVRRALGEHAANVLIHAVRAAFVASRERNVFPEWLLHATAQLATEHDVDLACDEIDVNLRTSARERWHRRSAADIELVWDPEAVAGSPCRAAFAWLVHWAETSPTRRDRERAQRALSQSTRTVAEGERPFAMMRRYGLDDRGTRHFVDAATSEELHVRVRQGGAINVTDVAGAALLRLPPSELGARVRGYLVALEAALLEARRTLAEAYADKLVVDARFVKHFLLAHPLWRPVIQGCVVRREGLPHALRLGDETIADVLDTERVRFVLTQLEA